MVKSVGLLYTHLNVWDFSLVNLFSSTAIPHAWFNEDTLFKLILRALKILPTGLLSGRNSGFGIFNLILVLETSVLSYFFLLAASKLACPLHSYI